MRLHILKIERNVLNTLVCGKLKCYWTRKAWHLRWFKLLTKAFFWGTIINSNWIYIRGIGTQVLSWRYTFFYNKKKLTYHNLIIKMIWKTLDFYYIWERYYKVWCLWIGIINSNSVHWMHADNAVRYSFIN